MTSNGGGAPDPNHQQHQRQLQKYDSAHGTPRARRLAAAQLIAHPGARRACSLPIATTRRYKCEWQTPLRRPRATAH